MDRWRRARGTAWLMAACSIAITVTASELEQYWSAYNSAQGGCGMAYSHEIPGVEAEFPPKLNGRFVGRHDVIELHCGKAEITRGLDRVLGQGATDSQPPKLLGDHVARVCDVRAAARQIRLQGIAASDFPFTLGDPHL